MAARTQFTFTFTNAQPGADVTFSAPVYADATTAVPDGPRLVLDSTDSVSVWADAAYLIATTIDGLGLSIAVTATTDAPTVTDADGTPGTDPFAFPTATQVTYDHTVSGLAATNVKAALDELTTANHLGASAAATTPGTVTKKVEVFTKAGVSLGFVAVYDAIT